MKRSITASMALVLLLSGGVTAVAATAADSIQTTSEKAVCTRYSMYTYPQQSFAMTVYAKTSPRQPVGSTVTLYYTPSCEGEALYIQVTGYNGLYAILGGQYQI